MKRAIAVVALGIVFAVGLGWVLFAGLPRWYGPQTAEVPAAGGASAPEQRIRAQLFYIAENGMRLVAVDREVPYGATPVAQAKHLIEAQLAAAPKPLVQAVPAGTKLRGVFLDGEGQAFVDLSGEVSRAHTGGSLDELFSVYAVVNALTVNLPAITAVQILVDGREVDTLAGHVDLRRPLPRNLTWVAEPGTPAAEPAPVATAGTETPEPAATSDRRQH